MDPGSLVIRDMLAEDIPAIVACFVDKPARQYERYLAEGRDVMLAFAEGVFAGYVTINWASGYPSFGQNGIPEIQDFNVLASFRRRGIGTRLMDEAERRIGAQSRVAGIGVGMDADYGPAQRLYVLRGYVPDGRGLCYGGMPVKYGQQVYVDDGLTLYLTKDLKAPTPPGSRPDTAR